MSFFLEAGDAKNLQLLNNLKKSGKAHVTVRTKKKSLCVSQEQPEAFLYTSAHVTDNLPTL